MHQKDLDTLYGTIAPWVDAYKWCVKSAVAIRTPGGPRLLIGQTVLRVEPPDVGQLTFRSETAHVIARRHASPASLEEILGIFRGAGSGQITVDGFEFPLTPQPTVGFTSAISLFHHPALGEGARMPSIVVRGARKGDLLATSGTEQALDWELKASEQPFASLNDLLNSLGLPTTFQMGDMTLLEIVAGAPAVIAPDSAISDGRGSVTCLLAPTLDVRKIRIGYGIPRQQAPVERGAIAGEALVAIAAGDVVKVACSFPVGDAVVAQTFLSYSGVALHQWWITDITKLLNPNVGVHRALDPDLNFLKEIVTQPQKGGPFEAGVAILLSLLGFSVTHYGRITRLQDGPDIIATSTSGKIAVVECTTDLLDRKDKLAKLVQRSVQIRQELSRSGYPNAIVQPVIVTARPRAEVEANLSTAARHGIAVVTQEDLTRVLEQVNQVPNSDRLFEDIQQMVPTVEADAGA